MVMFSSDVWGIGKTHLACSIGNRILERWKGEDITCPVLFVSEPSLYARIQATYNYGADEKKYLESEDDIINRMIWTPLLILDDIGKEQRSDPRFVQRTLFRIIDGRYNNLRPVVMTTNKEPGELKRYLSEKDEASFDRIWEMCGGVFLKLEGKSYRRR